MILGAFTAGVILMVVDRDTATHPHFRLKLEGIGYGFLIPVFFVSSGLQFDVSALRASASMLAWVPVFLVALIVVRGVPALLYRHALATGGPSWRVCCRGHSSPSLSPRCRSGRPLV